jgi:large subunit ribosomal protein L9
MDVAEALKEQGYDIDRRRIVLKDAIKETGEYTVKVKLHHAVSINIPLTVTPEGGAVEVKEEKAAKEETTAPAAAKEAPAEAAETEETTDESEA